MTGGEGGEGGGVLDAWQVGELFIGRVKIRSIFTVKQNHDSGAANSASGKSRPSFVEAGSECADT